MGFRESGLHPLITEYDGRPGFYVSCREYPTGDVEVTGIKLQEGDSLRRGGGARRKVSDKLAMDEATLSKSCQRARRRVRQLCYTIGADRLLTCTVRENCEDLEIAWKVWKEFSRLMKWRFKDRWVYVCAPEFQKRGAFHFHAAINDFFPVGTVRKFWLRALAKHELGDGNIDIAYKTDDNKSYNPKRIARYLAKYMTKTDSVEFNKRRFASGGKIKVPETEKGRLPFGAPVQLVFGEIIEKKSRKQWEIWWEEEGYYSIVYMST